MTEVEILKLIDHTNQFYTNPAMSLKHLKDGYRPDGMEKLQFPLPPAFIRALHGAPMHDAMTRKKWAFFMALQLTLHQMVGSGYEISIESFDVAAWRLQTGHREELLGKNKMKHIDEEIMAEVELNSILKVEVKKSFHGDKEWYDGMAFLSDAKTVMLTGHQLTSSNGTAIKVRVTARDEKLRVADTVAVPLGWFSNQGKDNSDGCDFGMANLKETFGQLPFLDCMTTPDTSKHPDGTLRGAVFGHPSLFPELCYAPMDFKFYHGGPIGVIHHDGDTIKGNSGSPVTMGQHAIGIHSGWEYLDEDKDEKINIATPINHHGNDVSVFRHILDYMAIVPDLYETLKEKPGETAKFLAIRNGGIAEVEVVGHVEGETRAVHFRWREVKC